MDSERIPRGLAEGNLQFSGRYAEKPLSAGGVRRDCGYKS
jgi:hypothetical protein